MTNYEIRSTALAASVRSFEPHPHGAPGNANELRTNAIIQRATAFEIYFLGEDE